MPFTPFHFGPAATLALLFPRRLDFFIFLAANVIVDLEPLIVILSGAAAPHHGLTHTFLFSGLIGAGGGGLVFLIARFRRIPGADFPPGFRRTAFRSLVSGGLGGWFHVLLDAPLYSDIRPFFPSQENPLYGGMSKPGMYVLCAAAYASAVAVYLLKKRTFMKKENAA